MLSELPRSRHLQRLRGTPSSRVPTSAGRPPVVLGGNRIAAAGYSIAELMLVLFIVALVATMGLLGWELVSKRTIVSTAAQATASILHQARMYSIYRGVNHFVVIDPSTNTLEIYEDSGSQPSVFDTDDPRVASTPLASAVRVALPAFPATLSDPSGSGTLSDAWSLPDPNTGGPWGSDRKGVMINPTGTVLSAESTPQPISNGVIVFSSPNDQTSAVTIRWRTGSMRSYELLNGQWKRL